MMADEQGEQLYGKEGTEQSLGYSKMPEANPAPETDAPLDQHLVDHLQRPASADWGEEIERVYLDSDGSGKRRPEEEVVTSERAADNLRDIRSQEKAARERELDEATAAAIDDLRRQVQDPTAQPPQAQPEAQQQPEIEQPQPEQPQWTAEQTEGVDPEIVEALNKSPKLREAIATLDYQANARAEAAEQQAVAQVQQAKTAYQHGLAQNAATALAVLAVDFPELAGLSGPQLEGALRVSNPQRVEAFRQRVNQVNAVVANYQQVVGQQQQQFREQQIQQYERAQDTFRQYAAEQDAQTLVNETPEKSAAIRNTIVADAKAAGIAEKELLAVYNSNSALRHSFVQNLLADGARYRINQRALATRRSNPVPAVARPGASEAGARSDDGEVAALWSKLNKQNEGRQGIRNAAELVAARRRARG